jgi:hypothetical protein
MAKYEKSEVANTHKLIGVEDTRPKVLTSFGTSRARLYRRPVPMASPFS